MKSTTGVISLMFLVAFFQSCYSRKCYQCDTGEDDECDGNINILFLKHCPQTDQCYYVVFHENNSRNIYRSCESKKISKYEWNACSSDECNGNIMQNTTNSNGGNIKCYVCKSNSDNRNTKCENIVDREYLKTCKINEECLTWKSLDSDNTMIALARGCVPKGRKMQSQRHCDEDGCNGNIEIASSQP